MSRSHGIRFRDTQFWITHRRREYGPFDYEWSHDFTGIELHYQGQKFGEFCNEHELFADLSEFMLPRRVVQVASLVFGCEILSILRGYRTNERVHLLSETLSSFGCEAFIPPYR